MPFAAGFLHGRDEVEQRGSERDKHRCGSGPLGKPKKWPHHCLDSTPIANAADLPTRPTNR